MVFGDPSPSASLEGGAVGNCRSFSVWPLGLRVLQGHPQSRTLAFQKSSGRKGLFCFELQGLLHSAAFRDDEDDDEDEDEH